MFRIKNTRKKPLPKVCLACEKPRQEYNGKPFCALCIKNGKKQVLHYICMEESCGKLIHPPWKADKCADCGGGWTIT